MPSHMAQSSSSYSHENTEHSKHHRSDDVSVSIVNPDGSLRPHQRYGIGNTPIVGQWLILMVMAESI